MNIELSNYIYIEFTLAIILLTEIAKKMFPIAHPKWPTLGIAVVGAVAEWFLRESPDVWTLIISFSVAVLGYDYVVKLIKNAVTGKNVTE